jgi:23S rRNA (adenine2503-C2)-methyltransferase
VRSITGVRWQVNWEIAMATDLGRIEAGRVERKSLFGMALEELRGVVERLGLPKYRAVQLADALYKQRVGSLEEITTLPVEVRERLAAEGYVVGLPEIVQAAKSVDGTERYLVRLADGETVETVWMPGGDGGERGDGSDAASEEEGEAGDPDDAVEVSVKKQIPFGNDKQKDSVEAAASSQGKSKYGGLSTTAQRRASGRDDASVGGRETAVGDGYKRATICISSQVGCAVNCQFCLTAKLGIKRNLTAGEIAGQVAAVLNRQRVRIGSGKGVDTPSRINLVFMGMGEPFLNYDAFMASVHVLRTMGIPESRMTVSTSGIEPSIRRFGQEAVRPKLALSLNASNDAVRREIMPITKKWDIAALLDAVRALPLGKREYVTFEYVLLGGVNDQPEHAREVLALLGGMKAKVNLIVWNPGPGIDFQQPKPEDVAVFHRMLIDGGIPTFTRRPRGRDIYAACGQLKRTVSEEGAASGLVTIAAV